MFQQYCASFRYSWDSSQKILQLNTLVYLNSFNGIVYLTVIHVLVVMLLTIMLVHFINTTDVFIFINVYFLLS